MHHLAISELVVRHKGGKFTLGPLSFTPAIGITSIVGVNGAGKSTLFNAITGNIRPASGSVTINDNKSVGYLPQSPVFPKNATCTDILQFAAWLHDVEHADVRINELLTQLGLDEHRSKRAGRLSGGMQRRLGIAQAIIHDPAVVLLDEPTAGLDPMQRLAVRKVIATELKGKTVLISTHLVEDIRAFSNNILVLREGSVVFTGSTSALEESAYEDATPEELTDITPLEYALHGLYQGVAA